jgi:hypothetical protein
MLQAFSGMHDFTVLILPGAYGTSVAMTLDVLHAAATLAPRGRRPVSTWRVWWSAPTPSARCC